MFMAYMWQLVHWNEMPYMKAMDNYSISEICHNFASRKNIYIYI